jgi:hypothetical protein
MRFENVCQDVLALAPTGDPNGGELSGKSELPRAAPIPSKLGKSLNVGARRVRRAFFSLTRLHESHALSYEHSFPLFLRQGGVHW